MGQAVVRACLANERFDFVGGIGREEGGPAGLIDLNTALSKADVILDFTNSSAATTLAEKCAADGRSALVIGATGFNDDELERITKAAQQIPVVRSANFSLGINLLLTLVTRVSQALSSLDWDIEIIEAHHRRKIDAPSGTALALGEAAAAARGVPLSTLRQLNRNNMLSPRKSGEIGFSAIRGGGIVGDHSVIFATDEEVLTLSHSAIDRSMFARGALLAANWVVGRPPAEYGMLDVLESTNNDVTP